VPELPKQIENHPVWFPHEIVHALFGNHSFDAQGQSGTSRFKVNEERRQLPRSIDLDLLLRNLQINRSMHMTQQINQFGGQDYFGTDPVIRTAQTPASSASDKRDVSSLKVTKSALRRIAFSFLAVPRKLT